MISGRNCMLQPCLLEQSFERYIKATFNDVVDFRECTALNAGRLLCMSIAYAEESLLEQLLPSQ
eukprot:1031769-Amphidinium_carterae.1